MLVACAGFVEDVVGLEPDVLVLPEYSEESEVEKAIKRFPKAIVIAAVMDGQRRMKGLLYSGGINQIDYYKIGTDGSVDGAIGVRDDQREIPIHTTGVCAIGVVICMDLGSPFNIPGFEFRCKILKALRACSEPLKLLCIPASMGSEWLSNPGQDLEGVYILLSNHPTRKATTDRASSRIFGPDRKAIAPEEGQSDKFIFADLLLQV